MIRESRVGGDGPHEFKIGRGDLRYWLGMAVTLLSLALLVRGVDFSQIAVVLGSIDYVFVAATVLTVILTILLKGVRWKLLFQPSQFQPGAARAITILTIGQMINAIFPLRFGEVGRVYLAAELEGSPPPLAAATIIVEKVIDSLMLAICVALVLPFMPLPAWLRQPVLLAIAIAVVAAILTFALACWRRGLRTIFGTALGLLPWRLANYITGQIDITLESIASLQRPQILAQIGLLSIAIWLLAALTNYVAFLSLGMTAPFVAAAFLLIILQVGVAVPSAPGRVGVFQAITVLGLSLFAVDGSTALTYSILLHLVVFAPPSVAGVVLLWRENVGIRRKGLLLSKPKVSLPGGTP